MTDDPSGQTGDTQRRVRRTKMIAALLLALAAVVFWAAGQLHWCRVEAEPLDGLNDQGLALVGLADVAGDGGHIGAAIAQICGDSFGLGVDRLRQHD